MELFSLTNPNPNPSSTVLPSKKKQQLSYSTASFSSFLTPSPFSFQSDLLSRRRRPVLVAFPAANGLRSWRKRNVLTVSFAASSEEEPKPSQAENETENNDLKQGGNTSQEAWEQALASFKEQGLKLQSVSQEAYEEYSKKATVVLSATAVKLKIQADQARQDLANIAKDLSKEGRQYLNVAAENSPQPMKDVIETFASADDLDDVSDVSDFYVGIPYGAILSVGGFLNFMITGSIPAIRFGVILGGILLALSVSSLRSWRKGEDTQLTLIGQAAIAGILFLREIRVVFQGLTFFGLLKTVISGGVAAFFIYRMIYNNTQRRTDLDGEVQT